jgi:hypothetical protein
MENYACKRQQQAHCDFPSPFESSSSLFTANAPQLKISVLSLPSLERSFKKAWNVRVVDAAYLSQPLGSLQGM